MTRNGRYYAPRLMRVGQEEKSMDKTNTVTIKTQKQQGNTIVLPPVETNAPITEAEACEFLKFIKHSEYNVVEQLNKTSARISLLSLLTSFKPHREALIKVLNQVYVAHNISMDKLDHLVENIMMDNFISFSNDEISLDGRGSRKLYISQPRLRIVYCQKSLLIRFFIKCHAYDYIVKVYYRCVIYEKEPYHSQSF